MNIISYSAEYLGVLCGVEGILKEDLSIVGAGAFLYIGSKLINYSHHEYIQRIKPKENKGLEKKVN